ncbi:FadR/GntR family transcriptional regulator [Sphingomonas sp. DT-204]|uniref:FadR/GntR family transcriptional regulator n=1 Tax=Sphingomonas sp. DT-204 TaxID=3396166 RepID=UPI003F1A4D8B
MGRVESSFRRKPESRAKQGLRSWPWIPAFAGMTKAKPRVSQEAGPLRYVITLRPNSLSAGQYPLTSPFEPVRFSRGILLRDRLPGRSTERRSVEPRQPGPNPGDPHGPASARHTTIATADIMAARGSNGVVGSAAGRVARAIGMDILRDAIGPGQKLPAEEDLLGRFAVSRTVLREALKILEAKGMVKSKTRIGTIVRDRHSWNFFDSDVLAWKIDTGLDAALLQTLREARLAVEPFAARLAAERATHADMAEMAESVRLMRDAVGNRHLFAQADLRFHRAVAAASGNFVLGSFAAVIETALVCATLLLPLEDTDLRTEAVNRHEELLKTIARRETERAALLMSDMINFGAAVGEVPQPQS